MADTNEIDLYKIADAVFSRYEQYAQIPNPLRVFICVWGLVGEVDNGGFDQYFFNSSGDHATDAPSACEAIGAGVTAEIVRRANAIFGADGPSSNRAARQKQLDALSEGAKVAMSALDREFDPGAERFDDLLRRYVREHPDFRSC